MEELTTISYHLAIILEAIGVTASQFMKLVYLLATYDPRIDERIIEREMGFSSRKMATVLNNMRQKLWREKKLVHHLRDTRPLGIKGTIVKLRRDYAEKLFAAKRISELSPLIPLPRLFAYAKYTVSGDLYVGYRVPEQLENEIMDILGSSPAVEKIIDVGHSIPVRPYHNVEDSEVVEFFERIVGDNPRFRSRMPLLDMIVYSLLDYNPLARSTDMLRLELLDKARLELGVEARFTRKYIFRHYQSLSDRGFVGRVSLYRVLHVESLPGFIIVPRSCGGELYLWASRNLATTNVVVGDEHVAATVFLSKRGLASLSRLGEGCGAEIHLIARGKWAPFPWELYDPRRDRWSLEPVSNLPQLLKKYRLIEVS